MIPALILVAILAALVWLGKKQRKTLDRCTRNRSATHNAYLDALHEWLQDEDIVQTAVDRRVLTRDGYERTLERLKTAGFLEVKAIALKMLDDKIVRREISRYMAKSHGESRQRFALLAMDQVEKMRN